MEKLNFEIAFRRFVPSTFMSCFYLVFHQNQILKSFPPEFLVLRGNLRCSTKIEEWKYKKNVFK